MSETSAHLTWVKDPSSHAILTTGFLAGRFFKHTPQQKACNRLHACAIIGEIVGT